MATYIKELSAGIELIVSAPTLEQANEQVIKYANSSDLKVLDTELEVLDLSIPKF